MSSILEIHPDTAARITQLALEQGLSVDAYLRLLISESANRMVLTKPGSPTPEEIQRFFDDLTAHPSDVASSYKGSYPREDIYTDHD